uniref:VPS37 C-terminal domain-containing protein n=1 Tax=Neogobius melanostomus TaxID=47308 RepID=A0A8C6U3P4_9GOBI
MSSFNNKFDGYTMTQLNEILEDDEKLTKMVQEMDEMQDVQQSKETTLANNRTLAEQNLTLQPNLELQKEQLTKRYSSLQDSFESYQLRKSTLGTPQIWEHIIDTLLALLQAEGAKIEEDTENMADCFLDGDMTLESFIDTYQSQRKLAHLRRVKIEKLQEMVMKGQRLPQAPVPAPRAQDIPFQPPMPQISEDRTNGCSPLAQARRKPPPPPSQPAPVLDQSQQPAVFYSASPYPPIPPRTGQPFPSVQGYPFLAQYAPALPQRPPPRMVPQPGFIMQ